MPERRKDSKKRVLRDVLNGIEVEANSMTLNMSTNGVTQKVIGTLHMRNRWKNSGRRSLMYCGMCSMVLKSKQTV